MSLLDQPLASSRSSLTTNSSTLSRIVRKRDVNLSDALGRSKSKSKQEQTNTSFQQYYLNQAKYLGNENIQTSDQLKCGSKANQQPNQKIYSGTNIVALSSTISTIAVNRNTIIQRGDRYINPRVSLSKDCSRQRNLKQTKEFKQQKQQKQKKRQPTPVKSKKQLSNGLKTHQAKQNQSQIFELQLKVAGLQQTLSKQKKLKEKSQSRFQQAQNDIKNLKQVLSKTEMQKRLLLSQKKANEQRIQSLQKAVLESENNLSAAQNNLNKLRQTIKQSRITQLQSQIKKLTKLNDCLKQTNANNQQLIVTLTQKLKYVTKQLEQLRKLGDIETLANKQSMKQQYLTKQLEKVKRQMDMYKMGHNGEKQKFLQQKIKSQQTMIYDLNQQISGNLVKIHCLQYFKSKQIEQVKQKSDAEIKALRVKYSRMVVQLKTNKPAKQANSTTASQPCPNSSPNKQKSKYNTEYKCPSPKSNSPTSTPSPLFSSPTTTLTVTNAVASSSSSSLSSASVYIQSGLSSGNVIRANSFGSRIVVSASSCANQMGHYGTIGREQFLLELSPQ